MATESHVSRTPFVILFIHGSWHTPAHGAALKTAAESAGHEFICPALPTMHDHGLNFPYSSTATEAPKVRPPEGGWPDFRSDVAVVRKCLEQLVIRESKTVLLAGHSYGGWPASEVLTEEFTLKKRAAEGKKGGVAGLFLIDSFLVPMGMTMTEIFYEMLAFPGYEGPGWVDVWPESGLSSAKEPLVWFYNGMPEDEANEAIAKLKPQCAVGLSLPTEHLGFLNVPCVYILGENDQLLTKEYQMHMVERAKGLGAQIKVYRRDSDHSQYVLARKHVGETVRLMEDFMRELGC